MVALLDRGDRKQPLMSSCPMCGAPTASGQRFCLRCGTTVSPGGEQSVNLALQSNSAVDREDHDEYDVAHHLRELMRASIPRLERRALTAAGDATIAALLATGETPLGLTSVLYEQQEHLLTVTERRLLCIGSSGELSVDLSLDDIVDVHVVDDERVQGISVVTDDASAPILFDVGDVEWSEYIVGLLLDEEDGSLEVEEAHAEKFSSLRSTSDTAAEQQPTSVELLSQLERLAELRRQNLLSADEFAAAKRLLLESANRGGAPSAQ